MSDPTTAGAVAATASAVGVAAASAFPELAQIGIDPPAMIAGALGVIVTQTFFPEQGQTWGRIALITVASMLFASFATAIAAPIALDILSKYPRIDPVYARAGVAAMLGGFAHPLLLRIRRRAVEPSVAKEGGTPNA